MPSSYARSLILLAASGVVAAAVSCAPAAPEAGGESGPLRVSVVSVEREPQPGFNTGHGVFRECRYKVSVENVSGRTVRGYALRSETMTEPPAGDTIYPDVDRQTLRPGESATETLDFIVPASSPDAGLRLTVEYVNFDDGTTWGSGREHDAFVVRGKS